MQNTVDLYQPEANVILHKNIRFHPSLSFGEKVFYAEISSLAKQNKNQRCPLSSRKLGELFGVSHQAICNWIRKLVELDLLEVGVDYSQPSKCRQFLKPKLNQA